MQMQEGSSESAGQLPWLFCVIGAPWVPAAVGFLLGVRMYLCVCLGTSLPEEAESRDGDALRRDATS